MNHGSRGTTLPETAFVASIVLLLLLGIVQLAIVGFYQSMSDGAAFVAAHVEALNPLANGPQVAATVYPQIHVGDVTISTDGSLIQATVNKSTRGLLLVPGASSTIEVHAADLESQVTAGSPAPYAFAAGVTLKNYCPNEWTPGISCVFPYGGTYGIYIAQSVDTVKAGVGWNGPFAEWRCHQNAYAEVNFPRNVSSVPTPGPNWDPTKNGSPQHAIYGWDPTPPSGKQTTCK